MLSLSLLFFLFCLFCDLDRSHVSDLNFKKNINTHTTRKMMMTKRKTSLLAIGATATLMALAPTAVRADAYGDAAHSCEYLAAVITCAAIEGADACAADTDCAWDAAEEECGGSETLTQNFVTATVPPEDGDEVAAGQALYTECAAKAEADCTGSCEWMTSSTSCGVSEAGVKSKITNELGALHLYRQLRCGEHTAEAACSAESKICEWNSAGAGECEPLVTPQEYLDVCNISPASRLTKVSAVVSAVFVAALASLA